VDDLAFIKNPHDALFRAVFGDPDNAAELLRSILPAEITAAIDWRTLRRVEGSFVDDALRDKRAEYRCAARLLAITVSTPVGNAERTIDCPSVSLLHGGGQQ
jgi:hypothetical protein